MLVLEPASLSWAQRASLRDAFDDSGLPFRVDIVEAADLGSGGVAARARQEMLPLP